MREFRAIYSAPCRADRLGKISYVDGRVNVRVPLVSAQTGEAMLDPFSDGPAYRACLAGIGGVDIHHGHAGTLRLVGDKVLQLAKGPAMQPRPDPLAGLDVGADMGQVFHADLAGAGTDGFGDDGLADCVVDRFDMPLLAPGDSAQLTPGCATAVGLETAAMGKVLVALMPQSSAAEHLASAGGAEIVLAHIDPENAAANRQGIRQIEDEIEIPNTFSDNEPGFLRQAVREQLKLMLAADERNNFPPAQSEQGNPAALDRISALVEIDRRGPECNDLNRLVLVDAPVGGQSAVSVGDAMDRLAHHLTAQSRKLFAHRVIDQVVQGDTVPAKMFKHCRNDGVARAGKIQCQRGKRLGLLARCQQLQGCGAMDHIGSVLQNRPAENVATQPKAAASSMSAPFTPRPEDRGFSEQI